MSKQYPGGIISKTPVVPSGPYETSTASGIWTLEEQAYWRKLNQWPIAGSPVPDPQFNYVTMLLHGDGTNGAQNNTFIDSSTNNLTITRNGNTTQGSFSPYGSNWSNFFDGSGDYLSAGSNSAFAVGTGDFTFQTWVFPTAYTSPVAAIFDTGSGVVGGRFSVVLYASGILRVDSNANLLSSSSALPLNQWTFISIIRSSGTMTMYFNGTSVASGSITDNFTETQGIIGKTVDNYYFQGYISNLRLVKGTALANTVPTAPLTAVSGTSLLTCQSNRFIDNSGNSFPLTVNGNTSVQRFNPFGTATAYSTSVIGGSGYFDTGGDDYLSLGTATALGTGNVTVEFWFNTTDTSATYYALYDGRSAANTNTGFGIFQYGQTIEIYGNGLKVSSASSAFTANTWNHFAVVRTSGTCQIYINGVASGSSASYSDNFTSTTRTIARNATAGNYFAGYISNLREVTSALYSGTFTPSTTPLTAISGTSLLLNFTNGAIFDNAMMNDLETVGNAQISTSVKKYGTGSLAFDGTGDYLVSNTASSDLYAFGTGNFTIEFWLYLNSTSSIQVFYDGRPASSQGLQPTIYTNSSGTLIYYTNATNQIIGSSLSTSTWYHIAVARSGTSTKMFVDGTQVGSTYTDSTNYVNPALRPMIGADGFNSGTPGGNAMNGYIDDLRITKGYARYTANFTPPTAAFSNFGPT